jgi:hypothetical protein
MIVSAAWATTLGCAEDPESSICLGAGSTPPVYPQEPRHRFRQSLQTVLSGGAALLHDGNHPRTFASELRSLLVRDRQTHKRRGTTLQDMLVYIPTSHTLAPY